MVGICSFSGYVPRYRLNRMKVYEAVGWMNPGNIGNERLEKAVANFDEDIITMAVAAGLIALTGMDRSKVEGVYLASTTMPYKERLNAGIVSAALGLNDHVRTADFQVVSKRQPWPLLKSGAPTLKKNRHLINALTDGYA